MSPTGRQKPYLCLRTPRSRSQFHHTYPEWIQTCHRLADISSQHLVSRLLQLWVTATPTVLVLVKDKGRVKVKVIPTATPIPTPTDQQIHAPSSSPVQHQHNNRAVSSPHEAN